MSDRPQGSVRTGAGPASGEVPADDAAAGGSTGGTVGGATAAGGPDAAAEAGRAVPATGTQAIPTTGTQAIPTTGTQRAAAPATPPPPAPPVPPPSVPPAASVPASAPGTGGAPTRASGAPTVGAAGKGVRGRASGRGPRRARLQLRHIDTWSALKISLVLSIALFFIWMVAVGVLYGVLNGLGVFDTLNELFGQLGTESGADEGSDVLTPGVVFGGAAIIGAINIVLLTALCTVGTFIYNMCSDLVGGLELTLSERD